METLVFAELERETQHQLDELLYSEHLATMNALTGDDFSEERRAAREVYNKLGRRLAPWMRWTPEKTPADMWREAQKRHEDPEYMARLRQLQGELDARAATIKAAVQTELELRKAAQKDREERAEAGKERVGRHYGRRIPWRSRSIR
jgi:hypothetical protein